MYKVTGGTAVPGALGLMSGLVFAAAEDQPNVTLNTDEPKLRYVEPEIGHLEGGLAALRTTVEPYATWCEQTRHTAVEKVQGAYGTVKPKVDSVIQFGNDSYTYLKSPPAEFYPRAGVIGFAGILGLFLARGSRVKKLIYPTGLMAVGASMYYPQQAADIAKTTGDSIYDWALQGYVAIENVLKPASKPVVEKSVIKEKAEEKSTTAEAEP